MGNEQSAPSGPLLVDADFLYGSATTLEFVRGGGGEKEDDDNNDDNDEGNNNDEKDADSMSMSYSDSSDEEGGDAARSSTSSANSYSPNSPPTFDLRTPPKSAPPQSRRRRIGNNGRYGDNAFSPGQRLASFLNRLDSREFDAAAHRFFLMGDTSSAECNTEGTAASTSTSPRSPPLPRLVDAGFGTYYGEEDRYTDGGDGYGFFRDEESNDDGSRSSASEAGAEKSNGWMFSMRPKKRSQSHQEEATQNKRGLPFSACALGNPSSFDEDEVAQKRALSCDDSTIPDDLFACYAPTFIMKVTQSTNDLDRDYHIPPSVSAPSLFQGFLGQRSIKSDPNLLSTVIDADTELDLMPDGDESTPESDLRPMSQGGRTRKYHIVTTAALPWMTGTAVNPLLRCVYLNRAAREEEKAVFETKQSEVRNLEAEASTCTTTKDDDYPVADEDTNDTEKPQGGNIKNGKDSGPTLPPAEFKPSPGVATLVIPWLTSVKDRKKLYGDDRYFNTQEEQESYIRDWVKEMAGMPEEAERQEDGGIGIVFYDAAYYPKFGSIFAIGNICSHIRNLDIEADVAILEEPEHLNWFNPCNWTETFVHVIGIIHTNYKSYASAQPFGSISSGFLQTLSTFVVRAHCNKVINLSGTLPSVAPYKEMVCNVHGIRSDFLEAEPSVSHGNQCQVYFIGKLLWEKGFDKLLDLQSLYKKLTGEYFEIRIYGSGPDQAEIKRAFHGRPKKSRTMSQSTPGSLASSDESGDDEDNATAQEETGGLTPSKAKIASIIKDLPKSRYELRRDAIPARFLGRKDHAGLKGAYKVFVNCSISEVLCTTTAESIAMGNWVIIPFHPSNDFFARFPSALMYRSQSEFVEMLQFALKNDPPLLSNALSRELTWTAATERLIHSSVVTKRQALRNERLGYTSADNRSARFHTNFAEKKEGITFRNMFLREEEEEDEEAKNRPTKEATFSTNMIQTNEPTIQLS